MNTVAERDDVKKTAVPSVPGAAAEKESIAAGEIRRHKSYDANGYVFSWRGRIFRAIYDGRRDAITKLWTSGLIQELIRQRLFPDTHVTGYATEDSSLVFEHRRIDVISYPAEWSFRMLQDAALATVRVNRIARKYGYQTLDAHGFNIAFWRGRAMFIDMGSFVELANDFHCKRPGWRPYGEFMRSFYAPLKLWSMGADYFARKSLYGEQMPMVGYWRYRSHLVRMLPDRLLQRFEYAWYKFKELNTVPVRRFVRLASVSRTRERLAERIVAFSKRWGLPFSAVNLKRLERRIAAIRPPRIASAWAQYHEDKNVDDRQRYIVDTIEKLRPSSVLDMAGNAGFFSKYVAAIDGVDYVICADYDANAIDQLHLSLGDFEHLVYPTVTNFSISVGDSKFPDETERFTVDMVLALALTHHLMLTQGLTLDFVLGRLKSFARRYVAVEFMPLGLYSSELDRVPDVPEWYRLEYFRQGFLQHFKLLDEREIATNRVMFVGEILG